MNGTLNGEPLARFRIRIPEQGPWVFDCSTVTGTTFTGRVTIKVGSTTLIGTIRPESSGAMVGDDAYRIVAGAGGWGTSVSLPGHHNDAGVRRKAIAAEVAALVGETIGMFATPDQTFGVDYAPRTGTASRVLEDCAAGVKWYVDFAGVTNVQDVAVTTADPNLVHVLDYSPLSKIATIGLDDLAALRPGMRLPADSRFTDTLIVREIDVLCSGDSLLAYAWCGNAGAGAGSRLSRLMRAAARRATDDRIWGKWRYRVLRQADDGRVDLQSVAKETPDQILVPQRIAVAVRANFKPGQIVLVEFLEGRATLPRITAGDDSGAPGFFAESIELGGPGTQSPIAIAGSLVQSGGIGQQISFSDAAGTPLVLCYAGVPPVAAPPPYYVSFSLTPPVPLVSAQPLMGAVMTGSKTAKAGPP